MGVHTHRARSLPPSLTLPRKGGGKNAEDFRMLSRTAENLYWLARYVERAEYLARTIDATLRVTALPGRLYRQDQ